MTNVICIYHGNCADGFGAAWAVREQFPDAVFHPAQYGDEPPDCVGKRVYIVDFSYPREILEKIASEAYHVFVLDHHKTAAEHVQPLLDTKIIGGVFDLSKSGAVLAWEFFNLPTTPTPKILQYIQDRDLWKFELPYSKEVNAVISSHPQDFKVWDELVNILEYNFSTVLTEGFALKRQRDNYVEQLVKLRTTLTLEQRAVPAVNAPPMFASEVGNRLCELYPDAPYSVTYCDLPDGKKYSLRSIGDFDVSEVAKRFGGGGHKNAAGFLAPKLYVAAPTAEDDGVSYED